MFLSGLVFSLAVIAAGNNGGDVVMVSYEQSYLDSEGTLALKNNTDVYISSIDFRIIYFDMSGRQLDYEDYSYLVDIAPGMTKKIDIPAYEHGRCYSYYKSEASFSDPHLFKVGFELINYDSGDESASYGSDDGDFVDGVFWIAMLVMLFVLGAYVGLWVLVAVMAKKRHRSAALWVLVAAFLTPVLVVIILLFIGKSDGSYKIQD